MEDQWLTWAKRLQSIASTGLFFGSDDFDKERYAEVADIADAMLASLGTVPLQRIAGLIPDFAQGYSTPKVDVRGAVFKGEQVLLVQEKSDGLWTLPGGYADVGLSAAENVVKEIHEEACLQVRASRLYSVRHKAKHPFKPDVRDFYKFYFLCEQQQAGEPAAGMETADVGYFSLDALPPLSTGRVIEGDLHQAYAHMRDPNLGTQFD